MKSYFSFQGDPLLVVCENNVTGIVAKAKNNIPVISTNVDLKIIFILIMIYWFVIFTRANPRNQCHPCSIPCSIKIYFNIRNAFVI